jgi:menaquinone-specific isochorismate synthase
MTILPLHPANNASPDALRGFLEQCQQVAAKRQRAQLVSISIAVDALDPLAVLESIFDVSEPHFYAERPALETAIAGAEIATDFVGRGPTRFPDVQRWVDNVLENAIAVGDVTAPFGGPHFFAAFTFAETVEATEPFQSAYVFVPRWQVARAGATTTAVANLMIEPTSEIQPLVDRVWRAHAKFRRFEYGSDVPESASGRRPHAGLETTAAWSSHEAGDYRSAVARALRRIDAGQLDKIVLARAVDVSADRPFHPLEMLNGLRQRFPDCYAFSYTAGGGRSFIGATPERLVRVTGGTLETEALAGSMRRGATASEDAALATALLRSEKDLREQKTVLDDIVARLAPLGLHAEYSAQPQIKRLANVQHLQTPIQAIVPDGVRVLDIVAAMHPTPAVGGIPRQAALAGIRDLEGFPRSLYAGALGWINARGGGEFFVGIRSAIVEGASARLFAGAGIVAGSSPEKEFAETELKFKAMVDAFRA